MVHDDTSLEAVKLFLEKGADVNVKDNKGETPLFRCWGKEVTRLFLEHGAEVNIKNDAGETPLHLSIDENTKVLIEYGADVNAKNARGETPIFNLYGNSEKAKLLIAAGAEVNIKNDRGETPLERAGNLEVAKVLIENGAEITENEFHYAILMDEPEKIKKFIAEGVDLNKPSEDFMPLEYAAFTGNIEIAQLLLDNGADIAVSRPLFMAIAYNRLEMAEFLIKNGADVNGRDDFQGYTPLDVAKSEEMKKLLVKYGAKNSGIPIF